MIFLLTNIELKEISERMIIKNKIKAGFETDLTEEQFKERALEIIRNEGLVYILTDSKEKAVKGYYFFVKEADTFRLDREYTGKIPAKDIAALEETLTAALKSRMMDIASSSDITVNKTYFHDEIILRDTIDIFNRVNGCRIVRVKPGKLNGCFSMTGMSKESFDARCADYLSKGGEIIAVTFKKNIVGAYFFERDRDELRLAEKYLINSDLETKARIEGNVRDRIMKIMLYSSFGRKQVINKCYFYDEVISRDYFSPISIWICAGIILITIDAGLAHIAGFFIALAVLLLCLFIYSFRGRKKIADMLER